MAIGFFAIAAVSCSVNEPILTFQGYLDLVSSRFEENSLDCGVSDITEGLAVQTNPDVVTCLHNAFLNEQTAHGYLTIQLPNTGEVVWFGYTTSVNNVERFSYAQDIENPNNTSIVTGSFCENPSVPIEPSLHPFSQFDCELSYSIY